LVDSPLANHLVVVGMCTYPEPVDPIRDWQTERAVLQTNPNGPELPDLLEVQRRMMRIPVQ